MPQIDHVALEKFFEGDAELLGDLANMFAQSWSDCRARITLAVDGRDGSSLCELAHQLRGRLGYFSAMRLQELTQELENRGKSNRLEGIHPLVDQLLNGIDGMMGELRELTGLPLNYGDDD
jgi:HPt (histidine-containing phosphotransfer) domain-containing protein